VVGTAAAYAIPKGWPGGSALGHAEGAWSMPTASANGIVAALSLTLSMRRQPFVVPYMDEVLGGEGLGRADAARAQPDPCGPVACQSPALQQQGHREGSASCR
jgi:hypothetical protein